MARKYVVIVPDGAGDRHRLDGCTPLMRAFSPHMDFVAREGASGLMRTLHPDLPRESLVAQLGMLGWPPHEHYPGGRASSELLAVSGVALDDGDLAFRANFVRMDGTVLASYNADYIRDPEAAVLAQRVQGALGDCFPEVELFHNSDFRNVLVVRGANAHPNDLVCHEPHESHGQTFDVGALVSGTGWNGERVASRLNQYLRRASGLLAGGRANALFPWSPSSRLSLPPFAENTGFRGRAAVAGAMDFLRGIALAGGLEFHPVGNGRPDTDFARKGRVAVDLLAQGCELVFVHINAADEAAHMHDVELKVRCIEQIDAEVVRPVVEYFRARPDELGGVMVVPDHYTNSSPPRASMPRSDTHSTEPVPFSLWNGRVRDGVERFGEDHATGGLYAGAGLTHCDLLRVLGVA